MAQTLLEELGGRDAVEAVVAAFYDRVLRDPRLQRFFRGISMSRLQKNQVDFFCHALGGTPYHGRDMKLAHAGMGITNADFDNVAGHLVATLESLGVTGDRIDRVVSLIAPLRDQIVGAA